MHLGKSWPRDLTCIPTSPVECYPLHFVVYICITNKILSTLKLVNNLHSGWYIKKCIETDGELESICRGVLSSR